MSDWQERARKAEHTRTSMTKIREWVDADGPEPEGGWEWPSPPAYTEWRVEGQMRADVLARIGRSADDPCVVRLVEGVTEGGYSEYTVEHDYPIEVWVDDDGQSQRVYETETWDSDTSLSDFTNWLSLPLGTESPS